MNRPRPPKDPPTKPDPVPVDPVPPNDATLPAPVRTMIPPPVEPAPIKDTTTRVVPTLKELQEAYKKCRLKTYLTRPEHGRVRTSIRRATHMVFCSVSKEQLTVGAFDITFEAKAAINVHGDEEWRWTYAGEIDLSELVEAPIVEPNRLRVRG